MDFTLFLKYVFIIVLIGAIVVYILSLVHFLRRRYRIIHRNYRSRYARYEAYRRTKKKEEYFYKSFIKFMIFPILFSTIGSILIMIFG